MPDALITVVGILFILSVINEKLTQLVRSYPSQTKIFALIISGWFFLAIISSGFWPTGTVHDLSLSDLIVLTVCNLLFVGFFSVNIWRARIENWKNGKAVKAFVMLKNIEPNKSVEKPKEKIKEISVLSVLLGFIVAYLFDASLFDLFEQNFKMGWQVDLFINPYSEIYRPKLNSEFFGFDAQRALGFVITGFFLSFGSAFFHDLLDLLFAAKKARERLKDFDPSQLSSADQVSTLANYSAEDIAKAAVLQNEAYFQKKLGEDYLFSTDSVTTDERGIKKPIIYLNIKGDGTKGILPEVKADLGNGVVVRVPMAFVTGTGEASLHTGAGDGIANNKKMNRSGTVCCVVQKLDESSKKYFLTCGHVICSKEICDIGKTSDVIYANGVAVGTVEKSIFYNNLDYSLIECTDDTAANNYRLSPNAVLLDRSHLGKEVKIMGKGSEIKKGYIIALKPTIPLIFKDKKDKPVSFSNLIIIGDSVDPIKSKSVSIEGDSGCAVVINDTKLAAMVIAGDAKYTYAIPLREIFENENLENL